MRWSLLWMAIDCRLLLLLKYDHSLGHVSFNKNSLWAGYFHQYASMCLTCANFSPLTSFQKNARWNLWNNLKIFVLYTHFFYHLVILSQFFLMTFFRGYKELSPVSLAFDWKKKKRKLFTIFSLVYMKISMFWTEFGDFLKKKIEKFPIDWAKTDFVVNDIFLQHEMLGEFPMF